MFHVKLVVNFFTEAKTLSTLGEKNTRSAVLWKTMDEEKKAMYEEKAMYLKCSKDIVEEDSKVAGRVKKCLSNVVSYLQCHCSMCHIYN